MIKLKETKLTPILLERLCDECGKGVITLDRTDHKFHTFRQTEYKYIYKCSECGKEFETNHEIRLQYIIFEDKVTKKRYHATYPFRYYI